MSKKSMIIIGAGLAGLSAGVYAQMNGYESRIFEHHSQPGGVAAVWKRGDYLIDGGIHFLICHRPGTSIYDLYSEIGAVENLAVEDMTTYLRFYNETGSKYIDLTGDLDKLESDFLEISPEDQDEIRSFIKEIRSLRNSPLLTDMGMDVTPPELRGRFDTLKEMWQMRGFMKYFYGKFSKSARTYAKRFQSPWLRSIIEHSFSPDIAMWFVIMILASVSAGILGLIKDGCHEFVNGIVKKYESLGGQMKYRATVEKIVVENDKAVGVILSDETEHRADVIVSAADGRSTIFDMLDGKYTDEKIEKRYDTWKPYDPTFVVSLGVARTFEDEVPLTGFLLEDPIVINERKIKILPLRVFNYSDVFAPEGKSVIQIMLETDWEYWKTLRENREEYVAEKERIGRELIERLERFYPGISSQIEVTDIATPYTTWRYTLNYRGSPMGWQFTRDSLTEIIPRSLPGLESFYMAGQWILAGGGVPACIYSGRNVVRILCKKEGREFKTE